MADPKMSDITARTAVQPSASIPGVPPFVISVPVGWIIDQAPSALAVFRPPVEIDGFWINAILSHDTVARSVDFEKAAILTWQKLEREVPDIKRTFERMVRFGTNVVYLRGAEMTSPQSKRTLGQLQALFFAPVTDTGKIVDFFQIVCTVPKEFAESYIKDFMEIIGSFKFV